MCSIAGFNWRDDELLNEMLKKTHHRGPDSNGKFFQRGVSLGHNRLSILDLSPLGSQPMANEKKTIWIVFNGEIYNFKELRDSLKAYNFKSGSDTEVLIYLYEKFGIDMLKKLQGMFAFCIYDFKKNILFMARDRLGVKPFYYYHNKNKFLFCSEIKGLLSEKSIRKELNSEALKNYLIFRANTGENTFLKNIKKLMPGTYAIYDLKENSLIRKRYWDVNFSSSKEPESYFKENLSLLLEDSVKSRLVSDVPYGAYLSGGIDSGTIVALMKKYSKKQVKTFSVGFEEREHNELYEARKTAEALGTDHHEFVLEKNAILSLPEIIWHSDEPLADPTAIPTFFLSKYAKKYCTVILTGEGADEIFGGYPQYKFMKLDEEFISKMPNIIKKQIVRAIDISPKSLLNIGFSYASKLGEKGKERFSKLVMGKTLSEKYLSQIAIFDEKEQTELMSREIFFSKDFENYFSENRGVIGACQKIDLKNPLVEDLLMKLDKNTMAFGIEGRVPFLDYRLVELASKTPDEFKIKGNTNKYLLREIAKSFLPEEICKRKKKHFFVPIESWLENELRPLRKRLLSKEYLSKQGIFNYSYIENIDANFNKSPLFYSRQLWSLLVFQIWHKQVIENEKIAI